MTTAFGWLLKAEARSSTQMYGAGEDADVFALYTGDADESGGDMGLAGAGIAQEHDLRLCLGTLPAQVREPRP